MAVVTRYFCQSEVQESHQGEVQGVGDTQTEDSDRGTCAKVKSNYTRTDQLLPQVLASGNARRMERLKPSSAQMGQVGKRTVQVCVSEMAQAAVQRKPRTICALEIGTTIAIFA